MAASRVPQNAVDHVGSLKRPPELVQAWRDWEAGKLPFEALHEIQDKTIAEAVAMQERLGLPVVTDGEFRRGGWSRGFLNAVEGFEFRASKLTFRNDDGVAHRVAGAGRVQADQAQAADRDRRFQVPASRSRKNRIKVTMPTPSHMHFGQFKEAVDRNVYPERRQLLGRHDRGVPAGNRATLYEAGCRYLQLDEVPLALLCDKNIRDLAKSEGDDPGQAGERSTSTSSIARLRIGRPT